MSAHTKQSLVCDPANDAPCAMCAAEEERDAAVGAMAKAEERLERAEAVTKDLLAACEALLRDLAANTNRPEVLGSVIAARAAIEKARGK